MSNRKIEPLPIENLLSTVIKTLPTPDAGAKLPVLPDRLDRLLQVLGSVDTWISEFDGQGRLLYTSPNVENVMGFTPEECARDGFEFHPDDLRGVAEAGKRIRSSGEPTRNVARVRHKGGHWVWTDTAILGWYQSEGGGFHTMTVARDITALKHAEAAREESETRRRAVSQMSGDLITEIDEDGRLRFIAPGCEDVIGFTPDEAMAIPPWSLVHPEDVEQLRAQIAEQFGAGVQGREAEATPKYPALHCRLSHRDGHWVWLETRGRSYVRADGEVRYLAVSRDLTEQREAEEARRKFDESLQRAQKLEGLGVLAGGIAHDFNNLLTPILGAARLALEDLPEYSPVRDRLDQIRKAAMRAAALTSQMLSYAGQSPLRVERIDLSALVGEMRALIGSSVAGRTRFDLHLEKDLPAIEAEPAQISQVVMNLVTNAVESQGDGAGRVTIKTGVVDLDEPPDDVLFGEGLGTGEHVFLEVSDAGAGMDEETRARIFDPFFTTKFTGRGLGLAAVAGIVRAHRGSIQVESEPGEGTRFRVLLPSAGGRVETNGTDPAPIDGWRSWGTALVIDDDESVCKLTADVLMRAGMKVLTANDGHEGVKLFDLHADEIRVVLLDRTMPALSGADTLDAIRASDPDAKIVLVSGYSEERVAAELASRGPTGFLKKPFTPAMLLARVREALDESG